MDAYLKNGIAQIVDIRPAFSVTPRFYAQAGDWPFLKFFAVYPLPETAEYKSLAVVPAWGSGTVVDSNNPDFKIGEQYRGMCIWIFRYV